MKNKKLLDHLRGNVGINLEMGILRGYLRRHRQWGVLLLLGLLLLPGLLGLLGLLLRRGLLLLHGLLPLLLFGLGLVLKFSTSELFQKKVFSSHIKCVNHLE